jgi:ribosome-associated translation inhibitor RaiA
MRISYSANSLQDATKETLEEATQKFMQKIHRLIDNGSEEPVLRISVEKEGKGDIFDIHAELVTFNRHGILNARTKHRNLRLAVSEVSKDLKAQLSRDKDKRKK